MLNILNKSCLKVVCFSPTLSCSLCGFPMFRGNKVFWLGLIESRKVGGTVPIHSLQSLSVHLNFVLFPITYHKSIN